MNLLLFYTRNSWFSSDFTCAVFPSGTSSVSLSKLYKFCAANCTAFRYRVVGVLHPLMLYNHQTVSVINVVLFYIQVLEQGTLSQYATHPLLDVLLRLATACTEGYCILGEQRCWGWLVTQLGREGRAGQFQGGARRRIPVLTWTGAGPQVLGFNR